MDWQDLLEFYWDKMHRETDPELKAQWEYYVHQLTLRLMDDG